jgi:hypothetical protein
MRRFQAPNVRLGYQELILPAPAVHRFAAHRFRPAKRAGERLGRPEPAGTTDHSFFFGLEYTTIHPVKQSGYTLFAPRGTKIRLLLALAATECAALAGCAPVPVTAGTLKVGTN